MNGNAGDRPGHFLASN